MIWIEWKVALLYDRFTTAPDCDVVGRPDGASRSIQRTDHPLQCAANDRSKTSTGSLSLGRKR
jgi:hypothetical protein